MILDNKFFIKTDSTCTMLMEQHTAINKKTGEEYSSPKIVGFFPNKRLAILRYCDEAIDAAETVKDIHIKFAELKELISKLGA